jgi:hypothetical protein
LVRQTLTSTNTKDCYENSPRMTDWLLGALVLSLADLSAVTATNPRLYLQNQSDRHRWCGWLLAGS